MSLDLSIYAVKETEVFDANITHNLGRMASECGLYEVMWRPEEHDLTSCEKAIPVLEKGVAELADNRQKYEQFNPENGWGNYDGLLRIASQFLAACKENPTGTIKAWR